MTRWLSAASVTVLLASASDGAAQTFLGARGTDEAPTDGLRLDAASFGGADAWLNSPVDPETGEPLEQDSASGGANLSLSFRKATERVTIDGAGSVAVRYLPIAYENFVPGYSGGIRVSPGEGERRRVTWSANQELSYAPANTSFFFAGAGFTGAPELSPVVDSQLSSPSVDYQISQDHQTVSSTGATVGYGLSRRSSLSAQANYGVSSAPRSDEGGRYQRWNVSGGYNTGLTRFLSLRAGYGLSEGWQSGVEERPRSRSHSLDGGLDYSRPLSFSRRTTVGGSVGAAGVSSGGSDLYYLATGSASINHLFGRTWAAQASYSRNVNFVPGFIDPVLSDGVTASLAGLLTRRSGASLSANWSTGTVGAPNGGNGYGTTLVSAQYRFGLLRRLATFTEYYYFESSFDSGVPLPGTFPREQRRHGIRIGLSTWLGLLGNRE